MWLFFLIAILIALLIYLKFVLKLRINFKSFFQKGFKRIVDAFGLLVFVGKQGKRKNIFCNSLYNADNKKRYINYY